MSEQPANIVNMSLPLKEELDARHRKETRDLQARITQKKKQASKKTRKGVNDECELLERELSERHDQEQSALNGDNLSTNVPDEGGTADVAGELGEATKSLKLDEPVDVSGEAERAKLQIEDSASVPGHTSKGKKPNRQKARMARRAAEQDAATEEAAQEAASMTDYKAREQDIISAAISERGLVEHRVRSDGHCLYAAMADQLEQAGVPLQKSVNEPGLDDYKVVRKEVADWVLTHPDDYLPFLDEDEMAKGIEGYAQKIGETGEWGGQLEIAACARRWGLTVNVLQGDGRVEKIEGEEANAGKECWLAYYKHSFGLGEHYNSLRKKV